MALVGPTLLAATPSTTNASSYATGSLSPTAGSLVVVGVLNTDGSDAIRPTLSSAFATGGWTDHQSAQNSTAVERVTLFSAVCTGSPGSGAITADYGGDSQTGCIIIAVQYTGQHATTPILQTQATGFPGGAGVTSATVTLGGALAAATSQILTFISHNVNEDQTAGGGGTELASSDVGYNTPTQRMAAYSAVNDTSVSASWATSSRASTLGCEIVEAAGGTEIFGAASLELTDSIAVAAKKDAKGAAAVPLTAGIVASAVKTAYASASAPLAVNIAAAATKDAKGATATPLSFNATVAATKTAFGSTVVPIVFQIDTSGSAGETTGAASLELTFGVGTAGARTANAAASLPLTFTADTSATVGSYGAATAPFTVNVVTAGKVGRYGVATVPILFTFTTRGDLPSPVPNMDAILTGWIALPVQGYPGSAVRGTITTPETGSIA